MSFGVWAWFEAGGEKPVEKLHAAASGLAYGEPQAKSLTNYRISKPVSIIEIILVGSILSFQTPNETF
ncbi:hypothetical protein A6U98_33125 [Rhizobium sp. WYCCWR10014]|nr:hypothetical protein A6U98_33125 [Rhizobium sp. WYCCWR10014]